MHYKPFKDIQLSTLGLGNMRLPIIDGQPNQIDYEKAKKIVDECYASGINYYDTAYIYHGGESEVFLGKALKEYPRDTYYVADKFNIQAEPDYKKEFAEQLSRLDMDRIDFYLLHGLNDATMDAYMNSGAVEYFEQMRAEGKITYFGFSFHGSPDGLRKLITMHTWDFVQIQFNYYDWYTGDAKELYEILDGANLPIWVMEPVHGGLLANLIPEATEVLRKQDESKSIASWAMRWVMEFPKIQVVLSGMGDTEQLADNLNTFEEALPLSPENHQAIEEATRLQRQAVAVACTSCRYCTPNCPMDLDIPRLLKMYNDGKIGGWWRLSALFDLPEDKWPAACIGCGACTAHCPQSFAIPEYMREMAENMAKIKRID